MHGSSPFLQDLAVVMLVAGVVTVVFHRLRQPVVLGYILAGLIVGPHTSIPLSIHDPHTVEVMSELGVILLMFSLGLHFSLRKLVKVGKTALLAASFEIGLMLLIGYVLGRAFGWGTMDSLFLGAILSISSTTIIVKALAELGLGKERFAQLIFGILIVEDILAIAMLALLSGVAKNGSIAPAAIFVTLAQLGIFLASVLVIGLLAVPPLLRYVGRFKNNEVLLVASLGLCFGVSLLAAKLGYSVALGAFLIGAVVAEARERGKIETLIEPVRDMFSAIFFVAVGMLIQPSMLVDHAGPIAAITVAVVLGKVATSALGTFLAGNDPRTSMRVGMGLAQIGEFSFIIAGLGLSLKVTSDFLYPIAVTVSAITTLLTPYLIRGSDGVVDLASRLAPRPLSGAAEVYEKWVGGRGKDAPAEAQVRKLLHRWLFQIVLNGALGAGVMLTASGVAHAWLKRESNPPGWTGGPRTVIWLIAILLILPLLVVSYRKLRATSLVLAEFLITPSREREDVTGARTALAAVLLSAGMIAIGLSLLLLGWAILPPWPVLVVLGLLVGGMTALLWRRFERIYAAAQASLKLTLTRPPEPDAEPAPPMPAPLRDAVMESVEILPTSAGAGRLIRELQLRTRSGASAVGIERGGVSLINPGPDEEVQAGDRVLLLGSRAQLDAARKVLGGAV